MNHDEVPGMTRLRRVFRTTGTMAAIMLLPPFVALAIAPMLLLLVPVALIGVPFIIPAMLCGSLTARSADRQRASYGSLRRTYAKNVILTGRRSS